MYSIGNFIINGAMVITTFWIVNKFLGTFYEKRQSNAISILIWFLYGVFQIFVQMNNGIASVNTTIISIFFVILISLICYFDFGKTNILIIMLFHVAWALVEMMVFFCMNMLSLEKPDMDMIGAVISKIVMAIGVYVFSIIWKKTNSNIIPSKYYVGFLFIPTGSIYIAVTEFYSKDIKNDMISSMITFSILLFFNIIILETYSKISDNFMLEKEKAVYTQQINMMTVNTEEQKKIMENFHREKHDLVNKLIVLKNELEYDGKDVVIRNIDEIIQNCSYL